VCVEGAASSGDAGLSMNKTSLAQKAAFAVLAGLATVLLMLVLAWQAKSPDWSDLMGFYAGTTLLRQGPRGALYDPDRQLACQQRIFGRTDPTRLYTHPPFEALVFLPLTYLPFPTAFILWDVLNLFILAWSLYLLRPYLANFNTESRLIITVVILYPLISTLREGQDTILLLAALVAAFVSLKQNKEFAAGCALGASLFRFQFTLPFLVVFVVLKRWRLILGVIAVGLALCLASLALTGWAGALRYLALLRMLTGGGRFHAETIGMPNVRGFVYTLAAGRVEPRFLSVFVALSSLALLGWSVRRWGSVAAWNPRGKAFDLLFSLSVVAAIGATFYSFMHDLVVLALPAALVLEYCAAGHLSGVSRWRPVLPLILLFSMTASLNVEGGNRFSYLLAPVLLFAFAISAELPRAQGVPPPDIEVNSM